MDSKYSINDHSEHSLQQENLETPFYLFILSNLRRATTMCTAFLAIYFSEFVLYHDINHHIPNFEATCHFYRQSRALPQSVMSVLPSLPALYFLEKIPKLATRTQSLKLAYCIFIYRLHTAPFPAGIYQHIRQKTSTACIFAILETESDAQTSYRLLSELTFPTLLHFYASRFL